MIVKYLRRLGYSMIGVFNDIEISAQGRLKYEWSV
jgi:hypothetical protein